MKTGVAQLSVTAFELMAEFIIPSLTAIALMVTPEIFSVNGAVYSVVEVLGLESSVV